MANINELSTITELSAGDAVPVYSLSNGDTRRAPLSALAEYVRLQLGLDTTATARLSTERAAPYDGGPAIAITAGDSGAVNTHLILLPAASLGACSVALPLHSSAIDAQEIVVTTTNLITALTITGNGAQVVGAPTTLASNGFLRLRYDKPNITWYRIG